MVKLVQTYGLQGQAVDRHVDAAALAEMDINYKKISTSLGLHKDSFNYFSQVHQHNRVQNLHKLRQFYQTIGGQDDFLGRHSSQVTPDLQKSINKSALNLNHPSKTDARMPRMPSHQSDTRPRTHMDLANVAYLDQADRLAGNFPWSVQKRSGRGEPRMKLSGSQGQLLQRLTNRAASNANYTSSSRLAEIYHNTDSRDQLVPYGALDVHESTLPLKRGTHDAYDQVVLSFAKGKPKSQVFVTPTTTTGTDKEKASEPAYRQVSLSTPQLAKALPVVGHAMSDAEISAALSKSGNFQKFKEMVAMHLRKGDWTTKLANNMQLDNAGSATASESGVGQRREFIMPLSNFRQCLQVVGVKPSHAQIARFVVRGQVSGYEHGQTRSPLAGRTPPQNPGRQQGKPLRQTKSSASLTRPHIKAYVTEGGPQSLGVNVRDFLSHYM